MKFLDNLNLKNKLYFLFTLISISLISVSIIATINITNMKKKLDSLYFGSLIPVTELNEILHIYNKDLTDTIYSIDITDINKYQASENINTSIKKIKRIWYGYEHHFKRDYEVDYVEYVSTEIIFINRYIEDIKLNYTTQDTKNIINKEEFKRKISNIDTVIKKLLDYEIEMAKYDRKNFLSIYDTLILTILIGLILLIFIVLSISYSMLKAIHKNQLHLESTTKELAEVNKNLEKASYTDSLTMLYNRRYFNHIYPIELKRAKRDNSFITFMMLDIDFFKQYNDTYGHLQGDEALKTVSKTLQEIVLRASDFVFRLGGEEFGIILTNTDEENSIRLASRIINAIKAKNIAHRNSKVNDILTISIGIACCKVEELENEQILLSRADEMLYKAKDEGRDRFIITSDVTKN